jgi:Cu/Ag efflux protein CusF
MKETMMNPVYRTSALGLAGLLAACGQPETNTSVPANGATASAATTSENRSDDMGNMGVPGATTAKGTGTVTAIDKAASTITLDHGPIPEANWPAMTMGFKAAPGLTDSVKVGDKVSFDLKLEGGSGEITAIARQ